MLDKLLNSLVAMAPVALLAGILLAAGFRRNRVVWLLSLLALDAWGWHNAGRDLLIALAAPALALWISVRPERPLLSPRNLILALISEDDLYHPLQKASFRVWTDAGSGLVNYQPADFGLASDARWFMDAMAQVFAALQSSPTFSEYSMLVNDIRDRVRTVEHLRVALYGRIEHLDRDLLTARELEPVLGEAVTQINLWVGLDEIELSSPDES